MPSRKAKSAEPVADSVPRVDESPARRKRSGYNMNALGQRVLGPLLQKTERAVAEAFPGLDESKLHDAVYSVCGERPKRTNPAGHSAYILWQKDSRKEITQQLQETQEGPVSQTDVFREMGRRWTEAKNTGADKQYREKQKQLRAARMERLDNKAQEDWGK